MNADKSTRLLVRPTEEQRKDLLLHGVEQQLVVVDVREHHAVLRMDDPVRHADLLVDVVAQLAAELDDRRARGEPCFTEHLVSVREEENRDLLSLDCFICVCILLLVSCWNTSCEYWHDEMRISSWQITSASSWCAPTVRRHSLRRATTSGEDCWMAVCWMRTRYSKIDSEQVLREQVLWERARPTLDR